MRSKLRQKMIKIKSLDVYNLAKSLYNFISARAKRLLRQLAWGFLSG